MAGFVVRVPQTFFVFPSHHFGVLSPASHEQHTELLRSSGIGCVSSIKYSTSLGTRKVVVVARLPVVFALGRVGRSTPTTSVWLSRFRTTSWTSQPPQRTSTVLPSHNSSGPPAVLGRSNINHAEHRFAWRSMNFKLCVPLPTRICNTILLNLLTANGPYAL